jgi:multidrug efflux pump
VRLKPCSARGRATTYTRGGQEYDVLLQTGLESRRSIEDLNTLYVRGGSGELVPLSSCRHHRGPRRHARTATAGPPASPSASAPELNPGYTVADAVEFFETQTAQQPPGPVVQWGGQARDLQDAGSAVLIAFGLAPCCWCSWRWRPSSKLDQPSRSSC